jgi:serine/threonine protein kinase
VGSSQAQPHEGSGAEPEGYPQLFGKYVLVRPMARGGMGELFLAAAGETGGFEKLCVVKKVLDSVEDQGVYRRFLDEAKVVVRLNHANLVQVFDAGRVEDEYYLAMELVEGKDLRAVWNRCAQLHRRIPVDVAIYVIRQVVRGLEYAHDALGLDLVHRDISPPNLLVGYRGDVKLTDFGLAKSAIKREMTTPGVVFGRYSYLSPEQARGLPADRRTDIYACGIVLWELLTGRQLFPSTGRSHQQALAAVRNPQVRAPSQLVPGIPEGLDAVVLRSLSKDPKERFQKGSEFRSALSEVLSTHFPKCDADRIGDFMRDIFAREYKTETRDYADLSRRDFSSLRAHVDESDAISIRDVGSAPRRVRTPTIDLGDSDIVELDQARPQDWQEPSPKNLRESAQAWLGRIVAQRYRVDHLIGIGGMGAVFRATHLALGKSFALKVLHSIYTRDADIVQRFMREARAATQTGHPNIIDVVDIGTTETEEVYFVMELLEGQTLGALVKESGPLAVRRVVHVARQICRALAAAHEVGIIHRDLKSDNVVLISRGKDPDFVKVLDFGICKTMNAETSTTSPGLIMGSPDYMAPEQGAGLEATVASDIYAVGCIVYEMLTGRLPFSGRNAIDVLMQKGSRDADRVTAYRAEVPDPLAEVVARCLQRNASERPPSMRALEYELTRAVDGRAQAVAAVLGLHMAGEGRGEQDPSPAASASFHRAAIASLEHGAVMPPGYSPRENTEVARSPLLGGSALGTGTAKQSSMPLPMSAAAYPLNTGSRPAAPRGSALASAGKALLFVMLGGGLAFAAVAVLSPETLDRMTGAPVEASAGTERGATAEAAPEREPAGREPAQGRDEAGGEAGEGGRAAPPPEPSPDPDAKAGAEGGDAPPQPDEPIIVDDGGKAPKPSAFSAEDLVKSAEAALAAGEFTEPAEGSLALWLQHLSLVDPGNEAIGRLRKESAKVLLPRAQAAADKKQWSDAANAYRDLAQVWSDHPEAKAGLVDALRNQARVLERLGDHEGVLATADELLVHVPDDFDALMMRGDALSELGRWPQARDAYVDARGIKPRDKRLKKAMRKASRMAKKAEDNG